MADIAVLGLALDSRQIVAGVKALDDLTAAAKPAATSATALEKAFKGAATETSALGKAGNTGSTGLTVLDKAAKAAKTSTDSIARSGLAARHELINLGRQGQDVAVSLLGGQSPFTVLAQQGSQIFDVFSSSKSATVGGVFKQIGTGILGLVTPTRLIVGGIAAVAAGGAFMASSWKESTLALDDAARGADLTTRELSKLQAAASFKGIDKAAFNAGITGFSKEVYNAKAGMGSLAEVFAVNNKHASTFDGYLGTAADLIKNARNDQQRLVLLQQMGLPATMEWVRLLSGGAEGLKKAKDSSVEFAANDNLVASARRWDEAYNKMWTNFGLNARSAFQKALETGTTLFDRMERLAQAGGNSSIWDRFLPSNHADIAKEKGITTVSPFEQRFSGDSKNAASGNTALGDAMRAEADRRRNQATLDKEQVAHDIQMQQQRLGALSQVATVTEQVRTSELALAAARLQPGNKITDGDVTRIQNYTKATALGVTAIRGQTDAYNLETNTLGMATGAAAAYAAVQSKINAEKLKGNTLSDAQIATLRSEASALGDAAQRAENMRAGYDGLTNAGQTFSQSIRSGASAWDSLKAAGTSALDTLSSKLMKMATDNLWTSAFGGTSGGGLLSGITSLFRGGSSGALPLPGASNFIGPTLNHTGYGPGDAPGPTRIVDSAHFNNAPRFHSGIGPGERAAIIRTDESVLTPGQMKAVGGAGGSITVPITINVDATGADPAGLARVQTQFESFKAELPGRVVAAVTTARKQRQL
ncbi:hypothetical protein FNL55_13150 [Tardiphaga sp. vice352]|uniref:phage tail length tape measure family protein n=1 Tax=Tardiphaga sp. vice352 TaxID=2592816 RepID=UPI0011654BCF|nr:phage tail length tape measure family protein [Tardiphaga sp. vice352]QDM32178.1 hypothetical protein FNL55_13150 [Tardiphaga sp. vice352]